MQFPRFNLLWQSRLMISCDVESDNSRSSFAFRRHICEKTSCNNLFYVPLFLRVLFRFIPLTRFICFISNVLDTSNLNSADVPLNHKHTNK